MLFEFSPWLMRAGNDLGEPMDLLRMLPDMGAICFDMMGDHNLMPRPSSPLQRYFETLDKGNNSYINLRPETNLVGPWDDIMCWFPQQERSLRMGEKRVARKTAARRVNPSPSHRPMAVKVRVRG